MREELIGRFKTVIGYKDPQLVKRLFMDELDFYVQVKHELTLDCPDSTEEGNAFGDTS